MQPKTKMVPGPTSYGTWFGSVSRRKTQIARWFSCFWSWTRTRSSSASKVVGCPIWASQESVIHLAHPKRYPLARTHGESSRMRC